MRHRLIPTLVFGLLCGLWFVDHRLMSTKIAALSGTSGSQIELLAQRVADLETIQRTATVHADSLAIAKTINDATASIPAKAPPMPTLKAMKNVAVKAKATTIGELLN